MSDAKKQSNGKWRNLLYVGKDANGKRIYESFTADTKKEANAMAAARARELEVHGYKQRNPSEMTVGEAIDKYIENRDAVLQPKTILDYKGYRRNYFGQLMNIRIKDLTESDVQRAVNDEARHLSPKSVRNIYALLSSALASADPNLHFRINLPQKQKKEIHIPTEEQLVQLFRYVEGHRIEIPLIIAATCGLRRGEICALDLKKDIDYKLCRITVNKAISKTDTGEWVIKPPKTTSGYRTVDCPEWVIDKLRSARDNGYTWMNPDHVSTCFADICDKLNIDIRFHDLRHYYASIMLSLGVPDVYAMARMGHATPNMLKNVYQHIIDDRDKEATAAINNHFNTMQLNMQRNNLDTSENTPKQDNIV
jgi:integrase